ncbi:hypothetical protein PAEPH01_0662 [Pancytospora epiphaga]|nr:hypothetical protein PAEPH01_0662 [Pancytospora epiphaga]
MRRNNINISRGYESKLTSNGGNGKCTNKIANELRLESGCRTRSIPYVITWDGVVTKYHRKHEKDIEMTGF